MTSATDKLGSWAAALSYAQIPAPVAEIAKACLVDTFGVALEGAHTRVAALARAQAEQLYTAGDATVLGGGKSLNPVGAAFANGVAAHALDFDDNCYAGLVHGSAVVLPAVFAIAEAMDLDGRETLTAFVAGVETEYAVGDAVTARLYEKGWFTTPLLGAIGAAAGAARALRLDADACARATAFAVTATGGLKASFGSNGKALLAGRAAETGVLAALLAQRGMTAPAQSFEEPRGFARMFNDGVFEAAALDTLGRRWRLEKPGIDIKRVPVCLSAHTSVDALMIVLREHSLSDADVAAIVCDVPPIVAKNLSYDDPADAQQAQFSLAFALACVLRHGDIGLQHLDAAVLADPALRVAMRKVSMTTSPRWDDDALRREAPEGCFLTVTTKDGRSLQEFVGVAKGTAQNPLTQEELDAKFIKCTARVMPDLERHMLLKQLRAFEALPKAHDLFG